MLLLAAYLSLVQSEPWQFFQEAHSAPVQGFQTSARYRLRKVDDGARRDILAIDGDGFACVAGVTRSLSARESVRISFAWRASSSFPDGHVTNAVFQIWDRAGKRRLFADSLVPARTLDSGWRSYSKTFSFSKEAHVTVRVALSDAWVADWKQTLSIHDFAWTPMARPAPSAELHDRVAHLIAQLGDEAYERREEATASLVAIGAPARSALTRALRSADPEVKHRAGWILERIEATFVEIAIPDDP